MMSHAASSNSSICRSSPSTAWASPPVVAATVRQVLVHDGVPKAAADVARLDSGRVVSRSRSTRWIRPQPSTSVASSHSAPLRWSASVLLRPQRVQGELIVTSEHHERSCWRRETTDEMVILTFTAFREYDVVARPRPTISTPRGGTLMREAVQGADRRSTAARASSEPLERAGADRRRAMRPDRSAGGCFRPVHRRSSSPTPTGSDTVHGASCPGG